MLSLCRTARGQRPLDRVLDVLVKALEDENEAVAGRAEDFLLWLGEAAAPAVTAAVQHSSAPHSCVWILGQIGGLVALDPLMQALDHSNARIRAEACAGLGKLRDPSRCNHSSAPHATPNTSSASRPPMPWTASARSRLSRRYPRRLAQRPGRRCRTRITPPRSGARSLRGGGHVPRRMARRPGQRTARRPGQRARSRLAPKLSPPQRLERSESGRCRGGRNAAGTVRGAPRSAGRHNARTSRSRR